MAAASTQEPFVFRPSAAHTRTRVEDPLVNQTRREISEIVREIAVLSRQRIPADRFLSQLCDRLLRAMAAEGVVMWRRSEQQPNPKPFQPVCRLGRITDQSVPTASLAAHQSMLREVYLEGAPVVVPPTPMAAEPDVPANPTEFPAAVVPIESPFDAGAEQYVIEVFLEPVGGIATQRGYLRFVAQIADLVGEFFRADQFRRLLSEKHLADQVEDVIESFEHCTTLPQLQGEVVDAIATTFGIDRVGWCDLTRKSPLVAVSHVDQVDHSGPAALSLVSDASIELAPYYPMPETLEPAFSQEDAKSLVTIGVVDGGHHASDIRFVLMRAISSHADAQSLSLTGHEQKEIQRLARHAANVGERIEQRRRSGLRRLRFSPETQTGVLAWSIAKSMVIATIVVLVLCIPVPNQVTGTGIARPQSLQKLHASRDAIVASIHVDHGEAVQTGQVLIVLTDPKLEEQITSLQGRLAVLTEQQVRLTQAMVEDHSANMTQFENVRGQREITLEEVRSINAQLDLLMSIRGSLTLRADREGRVDAWQLRQKMSGKPVQRGDELIVVISKDSAWLVDSRVDQRRISHIRQAREDKVLGASVILDDHPEESFKGRVAAFGPVATNRKSSMANSPIPQSTLLVELEAAAIESGVINGAPATVHFQCGKERLAAKLFGDLWQALRGQVSLHLGIGVTHSTHSET